MKSAKAYNNNDTSVNFTLLVTPDSGHMHDRLLTESFSRLVKERIL